MTCSLADVPDHVIQAEIALRSAERPVVLEPVYFGHGDFDFIETDFDVPEDEARTRPFAPPEAYLNA